MVMRGNHLKLLAAAAAAASMLVSAPAMAIPYQVHMDNVDNLFNWSNMDDAIGDLYDTSGVKQVEVSYQERVTFGNSAIGDPDPQFWQAPEYGDYHGALFANAGGVEVLEVEITGLNGNLVSLESVIMGRWYPDGINTLDSDWAAYDGDWNLLASGNTVMTEFIDYDIDLSTAKFETVRFQMGDDNWDNGLIAFTYDVDVVGTLDMSIDGTDAPTPGVPGSGPTTVPAPMSLWFLLAGLLAFLPRVSRR